MIQIISPRHNEVPFDAQHGTKKMPNNDVDQEGDDDDEGKNERKNKNEGSSGQGRGQKEGG